jgi:hypothetical protein
VCKFAGGCILLFFSLFLIMSILPLYMVVGTSYMSTILDAHTKQLLA